MKELAPKYPGTKWIQLFGDPVEPPIPNLRTVSYNYYLGCYLSGYFAGKFVASRKIGYIGGISIPPLNADLNAVKAGAAAADPAATVTGAFAGSFQDPAKGHEIASQMYASGIEYIQTDSAATDGGIIQAANEARHRYVSVGSTRQFALGPMAVASAVQLDFGLSLYRNVNDALDAAFKGGHYVTGLNDGVIDFVVSDIFLKSAASEDIEKVKEITPQIDILRKDIISGALKIPLQTKL